MTARETVILPISAVGSGVVDHRLPVSAAGRSAGHPLSGAYSGEDWFPVRSVLIVDDEPLIATAIAEYLSDLGVEAYAVFDPLQALELLQRHPAIEALITDVRMPGINGPELVRRVTAGRPDITILYITGFAAEGELADAGNWPVLRKPFALSELGPALRGR